MVFVSTSIEIERTPEQVRKVFLDWEKYPEWTKGNVQTIEPVENKKPVDIVKGDKLKVVFEGNMKATPSVLENSERSFRWQGSLPVGLLRAVHIFRFEPSKTTPGATTFSNEEDFSGILSGVMGTAAGGFERFNERFKARVESVK